MKLFDQGGLKELLVGKKGGNNPLLIQERSKSAIASKLANPLTMITSYVELLEWIQTNSQPNISYEVFFSIYCYITIVR